MRKLLQGNKLFFISYLFILMFAICSKWYFGKEQAFLFVNGHHSSLGDVLFPYITYFGDGITVILFAIVLLFFSFRKAIQLGIIYLLSSQITQLLKRLVFNDIPRPSKYFEGKATLHFVDGVEVHQMMSFPSGHTTSIFAFMAFLAIFSKNKSIGLLYLLIACIAAYSRMYLAQHFLEDVIVGSIIGVITAFMTTTLLEKTNWYQSPKLNGAFLRK